MNDVTKASLITITLGVLLFITSGRFLTPLWWYRISYAINRLMGAAMIIYGVKYYLRYHRGLK